MLTTAVPYSVLQLYVIHQYFSIFSLKRNPLQQFWLLTKPMGVARNLSRGTVKFEASRGRGSWRGGSKLVGLGECCKLPQRGLGWRKHVYSGRKCHLAPVSQFNSVEPLDAINGTRRFCRTPVEKHCRTQYDRQSQQQLSFLYRLALCHM